MASNHHTKRLNHHTSTSFHVIVIIITLTSLFLLSSHYLTTSSPPLTTQPPATDHVILHTNKESPSATCDHSQGKWFYDPTVRSKRYDETCKEIFKGWNCVNRSGVDDIVKWRWQPEHCALPVFDPVRFLETYRDVSIGKWYNDPTVRSKRYDETCKEIFKGWNCVNRSGADEIVKWRWQPEHCALPVFDPVRFLETYRDVSIGKR